MTKEEAIKRFEKQLKGAIAVLDSGFGTLRGESNRLYLERKEMAQFAIAALRDQEERENPKPLTLDELRNMNGQPVWWWNKSCTPICMICVSDRFMDEPTFVNFDFKEENCTGITKYKWLMKRGYKPYRSKPREDKP